MRASFLALALVAAGVAQAQVDYTVSYGNPADKLTVTLEFAASPNGTAVRMPNWAPGAYVLRDNFAAVQNLNVTVDGQTVQATNDKDRWAIPARNGQRVRVTYAVPTSKDVTGVLHWSGPSTYLYVEGRTQEPCTLRINVPAGDRISHGLPDVPAGQPWRAPTYDVLADNPVSAGDLQMLTYTARGVKHEIALRGVGRKFVDAEALIASCKQMSEYQIDFFGGYPDTKYVWHFNVNNAHDGAGGLEHLSSTQISYGAGMGKGAVGVFSHEYFHLWNVKRIRSAVLGPFDYTKLPVTGALWWLEGVTDYYAHLLLTRSGQHNDQDMYNRIVSNTNAVRRNENWGKVSPDESSRRVGETNNGRGNSNGFGISYYNYGFAAGFCLDAEIRHRTGNKYSLDDVMLELWRMNRNDQPGFAEDAIRTITLKLAGPDIAPFYDKLIHGPGYLPVEEQLQKLGLAWTETERHTTDLGFVYLAQPDKGGLQVRTVRPLAEGKLNQDDVITQIGSIKFDQDTMRDQLDAVEHLMEDIRVGDTLNLVVKGADGQTRNVSLTVGETVAPGVEIRRQRGTANNVVRTRLNWLNGRA